MVEQRKALPLTRAVCLSGCSNPLPSDATLRIS